MKKYKLIKEYPGSDHKGIIVSRKTLNGMYEGWEYNYYSKHVENNPEYWEEVVEKDYEVLISKIVPQEILSVKRLSDGEIFTVGDRAMTQGSRGGHSIRQFRVEQKCNVRTAVPGIFTKDGIDRIWIDWEEGCGGNWLESTEKLKQPIFLTHDGKDIFAGDKVWWVKKDSLSYDSFISVSGTKFFSDINAYFLTQEAASDYINRSKVLFTTEDGVDIKKGDTYYFVDTDFSINLSNAHPGCGQYSERKYFSTFETAQYYVIVNAKVLSIEEFWEFVSKPGSNVVKQKALKRLVKKRLKIE